MIKSCKSFGAVIVIGLLLAGCYTDFGPVAIEPTPVPPPSAGFVLELGDRVTVTVYEETNLSGVYDVNPAGNLDLPLIGAVKAAGRTPPELERIIAERYKSGKFLDAPKVTVTVVEYRPIYVFG